ncbi:MAG: hypothetical protein LBF88_00475 [Planctomycetaceae bacterium]|jgi:hypothetical protein|nr:hypothetical protein [Planctomycetaceae bacterium]
MPNRSDWLPGPRADQILTAKDWLLLLNRPTPSWRVSSPNGPLDQGTLGTKTPPLQGKYFFNLKQ